MSLLNKIRCAFTLGQGVLVDLPDLDPSVDPFDQFQNWFKAAQDCGIVLPESMTVSTVDANGYPSCRVVLLKELTKEGFVFFTNYDSRKGQELAKNPHIALTFHWNILQRQVRIQGVVEKISAEDSNTYFQSRGRGSRIGAWASEQSAVITSRKILEQQVKQFTDKFADKEVPLPEFWGGYVVKPTSIEFWQGKADRLHDRFSYVKDGNDWRVDRLAP
ncbi:Pyridoxine/pyridoxamine 5'-phosphate oxidase-PNP/PMP oxidase-Pyridoxal 5'-phosphate synthase [Moritella viscosa]|uniref:pyridoxamine 5'-phosphate oxidase n=1 Tax=Moritella viscosa TaxID=80854 RepID=UPI00090F5C91|nr:pyridoxamine 5'-phosphate oxidase [Moritella viscosa]SGY91899.1 Pyridoxine/pyridoxamine 5'-phosphate oxidase-PNP/PMP oxidase-Pyridoxal 5'-phosphate synthase [Moritella viscosa]